ncbi:hypothetical protein PF003_g1523 [Phytophthora fragariae]|nr:hypothetical protein PF003_g1523 [Phytophthora fragariae]
MLQLATKGGAEVIVQTQPAPVFDLDKDTMGKNLELFNRNLSAKNTVNKKWHSVRASVAFDEGIHRWQVRLDTCVSKNIFIGVCTAEASMENYIGSDAFGYGFLANKAVWHNKAKLHSYGEIFKQGDVIEVTLDCTAKTLVFSRNGEYLGIAASNIRAGVSRSGVSGSDSTCKWYPAFSMYNKDDKVTLIPPPAVSAFRSKDSRPQNASTFELIDAMQSVLAYQSLVTSRKSDNDLAITKLFEKAYEAFQDWRHERKIFREKSLGEVIAIDRSSSATEKYGLAAGDSVFTSKGQCTVLGEYRHELWFEVDEGGSSSLFGSTTTQLASWSLSACREMLASPDEYPVHRHHKYKLELESSTRDETQTVGSLLEQQDWATKTNEEGVSYQEFVEAQERWGDSGISAAELDAKLIAELDAIASQQASTSSLALSFADVSTALLLERIYEVHGISAERGSSQTMARMGLLLYVNRCLYSVARLAIPRNIYATSLGTPGSSDALLNEQEPGKPLPTTTGTECNQVSSVAALLNSPHWGLGDPSDFNFISTVAARILFASQKEKIICEELRTTTTTSRTSENLQESRDREEGGMDSDLPMITMNDLLPPPTPFWECSSRSKKPQSLRLPVSSDTSIFVQLATQLAAQDARQWRRESSQPFEAIPISQTFRVRVEKSTFNSSGEPNKETICQQQPNEEDEDQFQQPSSKQTAKYLQLFENVVREVQSPSFPLFAPVELPRKIERSRDGALEGELRSTLQLDINLELFSPTALAQSRVRIPQLLLWYFGFGQVLGIAWRSKILLPLQFISDAFWRELATPLGPVASNHEVQTDCGNRSATRTAAIRAIRDGLFSIIPSRCAALLSGNNRSLRERLSDVDVNYVARLERHATYTGPRQERHDMFWNVVNALTSLERRMLEQFIDPDRRNDMKQLEVTLSGIDAPSVFVLEIADALADGRDHPDSCYPVVVQIGPQSSRLHLPAYSSAQTLRHKLLLAMTNIPFM